jgi:hypothetical protein
MRTASLIALLAGTAAAQTNDVGLTMSGGVLPVIYGQVCGPVGCLPFPGGSVAPGQSRSLTIYGRPASLFAVAIGLPGQLCLPIPGIDNLLLLDINSLVVLSAGLTSSYLPLPCFQGLAPASFTLPPNAPIGVVFRLQSFGQSTFGGGFAFGPTIEAIVQ